jgi:eukaryotic-like serine/threonine-protein kinase
MSQALPHAPVPPPRRSVRFGPFELNMETGELWKYGVRVRLQHRPFQILAALLESSGRLVTREDLRARLWPSDVFVDFESGLNTAMNRLRLALGDSAEAPVYIETLARLGYRFLSPVEIVYIPPQLAPLAAPPPAPAITALPPLSSLAPHRSRRALWSGAAILVAIVLAAALLLEFARREPSFERLTFRKGFVSNARFFSHGGAIVYSAEWNGAPSRLFAIAKNRRDSTPLNLYNSWLEAAASPTEFAIFTRSAAADSSVLAIASPSGGAPRPIAIEHVRHADWDAHGRLCLLTALGPTFTIEYPPGHKLYQSSHWIDDMRVSPSGEQVAFAEHLVPMDDAGSVTLVDSTTGAARVLSAGWGSLDGLAWNPSGSEVWFTAARSGVEKSLWAVALNGRTRLVAQSPGGMQLRDISPSGAVLVNRTNAHMTMLLGNLPLPAKQAPSERDISWLDWSRAAAISAAGDAVLFDESGSGGGAAYSLFLYRRGASAPDRIGSGRAFDLSSDGAYALAQDAADPASLSVISVRTRSVQPLPAHGFVYRWAKFFPGAREILAGGHFEGQPEGIYRQLLAAEPTLVNARLQLDDAVIDPTGRFASGVSEQCEVAILDLATGLSRAVKTPRPVYPVLFRSSGQILVRSRDNKSILLDLLDTGTGKMTPLRRIDPSDPAGIAQIFPVQVSTDLQTYVYSRLQTYSDLFLVSGLH